MMITWLCSLGLALVAAGANQLAATILTVRAFRGQTLVGVIAEIGIGMALLTVWCRPGFQGEGGQRQ